MATYSPHPRSQLDCLLVSLPDSNSRYPYLGITSMASVLSQRGIKVEILDTTALSLSSTNAISKYIVTKNPRIVGISVMSMTLRYAYDLVQALKKTLPDCVVVVGGAHINADHEIIVPMGVRYGFRGECDYAFADFCEKVLGGGNPEDIPGLVVNIQGDLTVNRPAIVDDLNTLPMPAYDLLPISKYYSPSTSAKTISMISSRGCPYDCVFCSKLERTKYRYVNSSLVLDQIEDLVEKYDIGWIEFVDEIFTLNKQRITELCEGLINRKIPVRWGAGTRADMVDRQLLSLMKNAGCRKLSFGVETGSEEMRFAIKKKITNEQYLEAIRLCKELGIISSGCMIFGHPGETENDMHETINFAKTSGLDFSNFVKMVPIPNSELFEIAKKEGSVAADVWTRFMLGEIRQFIYTPAGVDPRVVHKIYKRAWYKVYFTPRTFINNFHNLMNPKFLLRSAKAFAVRATGQTYKR